MVKVIPLNALNGTDAAGGKALNLSRLITASIPVPNGVACIGAETAYPGLATMAREAMATLAFPLIVRSSASIEDGTIASFAGQFVSVRDVRDMRGLEDALRTVLRSGDAPGLAKYLSHYNLGPESIGMAVIIQEQRKADWSGVLFSDVGGDPNILSVEASVSPGAVVEGVLEPVRAVIDVRTGMIQESTADKARLPDVLTAQLAEYAKKARAAFGNPQDLEWVWDGEQTWIVQSRPVTTADITTASVLADERERLRGMFGPRPPHLSASDFAEGLAHATPITVGLFRRFYATDGAWGSLLRMSGIPFRPFDASRLVVTVLGRLFFNKDAERDITFSRLPFRPRDGIPARGLFWKDVRWKFPGLFRLIRMWPGVLAYTIGIARIRARMFRGLGKHKESIRIFLNASEAPLQEDPRAEIQSTVSRLVTGIVPLLFETNVALQYTESFLRQRFGSRSESARLDALLRAGLKDPIIEGVREGKTDEELLEELGHRGPSELELSSPRWAERPEQFRAVLGAARRGLGENRGTEIRGIKDEREKLISMLAASWDQQVAWAFFLVHDRHATYREQLHDLLVRDLTRVRRCLLRIDRDERLYNGIWYMTIEQAIASDAAVNRTALQELRRRHDIARKIPLDDELRLDAWDDLGKDDGPHTGGLDGRGLAYGVAEGIVGTAEMLDAGEHIDILIAPTLDPYLTAYFGTVRGALAHAAIVAREYAVPVVRLRSAMSILLPGTKVKIDGTSGRVSRLRAGG